MNFDPVLCVKKRFESNSSIYDKRGASFRWSFGPLSAWGSIESTTILTTHPSLETGAQFSWYRGVDQKSIILSDRKFGEKKWFYSTFQMDQNKFSSRGSRFINSRNSISLSKLYLDVSKSKLLQTRNPFRMRLSWNRHPFGSNWMALNQHCLAMNFHLLICLDFHWRKNSNSSTCNI